jgi:hypothetical protein
MGFAPTDNHDTLHSPPFPPPSHIYPATYDIPQKTRTRSRRRTPPPLICTIYPTFQGRPTPLSSVGLVSSLFSSVGGLSSLVRGWSLFSRPWVVSLLSSVGDRGWSLFSPRPWVVSLLFSSVGGLSSLLVRGWSLFSSRAWVVSLLFSCVGGLSSLLVRGWSLFSSRACRCPSAKSFSLFPVPYMMRACSHSYCINNILLCLPDLG